MQQHSLTQFNQLSEPEKYALLEDFGVYLEVSRLQGHYQVALYALFGYYVEVWFDQARDQLVNASAFCDDTKLDSYLSAIVIPVFFPAS
jgi:hypothetical protein